MKIRQAFVSNSSSSSFICDISGDVESGWDMGIDEAGMYQCENGHTFLREYVLSSKEFDNWVEEDGDPYFIPKTFCPICQLNEIPDSYLLQYLLKKSDNNRDKIVEEIKSSFKDFDAFKKYIQ